MHKSIFSKLNDEIYGCRNRFHAKLQIEKFYLWLDSDKNYLKDIISY